jgi:hypothetical protein
MGWYTHQPSGAERENKMNNTETGSGVATGSAGPRLSIRGVVLTAVVGVGVAVGVLFATGAFDDDSDSTAATPATIDQSAAAAIAAEEHETAISEIELRSIELKQVFEEQPEAVTASPATIEGKQQQLDAAANAAFCQSCFDDWKADQQAQERADQRMADKLAQMDAYDAAYGLR